MPHTRTLVSLLAAVFALAHCATEAPELASPTAPGSGGDATFDTYDEAPEAEPSPDPAAGRDAKTESAPAQQPVGSATPIAPPAPPRPSEPMPDRTRAEERSTRSSSAPMKRPATDSLAGPGAGLAATSEGDVGRRAGVKDKAKLEKPMSVAAPPADLRDDAESDAPSAGGTFVHSGVNPLVATSEDKLSTFAIDVDTASYSYARRFLERGQRPNPGAVRVEEWINAFHYEYESPTGALPFEVHLAAAPSPFVNGRHIVRVGVQGKRIPKSERKPVNLTFLVDVSGSMAQPDKLPLAQRSLHLLVDELGAKDSVALVTYAGRTEETLGATKVTRENKRKIHDAIERLTSGGGTNMGSGVELAYKNAHRFLSSESESRVIILSDGDANIGNTSHDAILRSVRGYVSEGVTLSTVGFGTGNYQDHLMEQLADAGNGNYSYIDSQKAAHKVFVEDLTGTLEVIAQDVKIQVEMNPDVVVAYRLLGYENRDVADKDFRNDKVDAGEIGAGHTVTALYEVVLRDNEVGPDDVGRLATVRIRHKTPRGVKATEIERELTGAHMRSSFGHLDADTRFAAASALAAEILRGSEHAAHLTLADARELARAAATGRYADERMELVRLLSKVSDERPGVARR